MLLGLRRAAAARLSGGGGGGERGAGGYPFFARSPGVDQFKIFTSICAYILVFMYVHMYVYISLLCGCGCGERVRDTERGRVRSTFKLGLRAGPFRSIGGGCGDCPRGCRIYIYIYIYILCEYMYIIS